MTVLAVIPARFASTRLPGKPLLAETGKPLIQHVVERVKMASHIDEVIVATDDARIFDAVRAFGGCAMMTASSHRSGTDRVAEIAAQRPDASIVLNVQGDEPCIAPTTLDALVSAMLDPAAPAEMATVATPFADDLDPADPNAVKVVCDLAGFALYFSRAPIPFHRDPSATKGLLPTLLHLGIYAFRRDVLLRLASLPATDLEQVEWLEQLRAVAHGIRIRVAVVADRSFGIDTPTDYARFKSRLALGDC